MDDLLYEMKNNQQVHRLHKRCGAMFCGLQKETHHHHFSVKHIAFEELQVGSKSIQG